MRQRHAAARNPPPEALYLGMCIERKLGDQASRDVLHVPITQPLSRRAGNQGAASRGVRVTDDTTASMQGAAPAGFPRRERACAMRSEAAGLSIDAVAQQLKLAPRQVVALEEDNFPQLPGRTFMRGFMRNYARLLHLDTRSRAGRPARALTLAPSLDHPSLAPTTRAMGELPADVQKQIRRCVAGPSRSRCWPSSASGSSTSSRARWRELARSFGIRRDATQSTVSPPPATARVPGGAGDGEAPPPTPLANPLATNGPPASEAPAVTSATTSAEVPAASAAAGVDARPATRRCSWCSGRRPGSRSRMAMARSCSRPWVIPAPRTRSAASCRWKSCSAMRRRSTSPGVARPSTRRLTCARTSPSSRSNEADGSPARPPPQHPSGRRRRRRASAAARPIVVQSMTNTDTADIAATVAQVRRSPRPARNSSASPSIRPRPRRRCARSANGSTRWAARCPLIGDFHFNGHKLLTDYPDCAQALAKYRINPGNVGKGSKRDPQFVVMIEKAIEYGKPVRIGVNWGSLDEDLLARMMDENARSAQPLTGGSRDARSADRVGDRQRAASRGAWPAGRPDHPVLQGLRRAGSDRRVRASSRAAATIRCTSASPRPAWAARASSRRPRRSPFCCSRASATRFACR